MTRLPAIIAVVIVAASGCVEQDPRILPFAQPKLELQVGESIEVSVALVGPAKEQMHVDVSSDFDGVDYEPTTITYEAGTRVGSVMLTGANSTRGLGTLRFFCGQAASSATVNTSVQRTRNMAAIIARGCYQATGL